MSKTTLERMATPVSVTLESGDWDILAGLLTMEWSHVHVDAERVLYAEKLESIRRAVRDAQERQESRSTPRLLRPTWLAKGQLVQWSGQDGICKARIISVVEPQPGNYVLTVASDGDVFKLSYRQVIPVYEIGDEA